jgi:signal peptidase I
MNFLNKLYRFSSSWTGTIIIVLFLIFFVVQSFVIPSGSMKRTLQIGDFLFAKKFSYGTPLPTLPWLEIPIFPDLHGNGHLIEGDKPEREDIVIFRYPKDHKIHYVKRCVAKGGDELLYNNKHLYIHFVEGDAYITKNYPADKIYEMRGKLWVDNPYSDKYPGIQYQPENHMNIYGLMLNAYAQSKENLDMSPVYIPELQSPVNILNGQEVNAFYKKVEADHYYMMGDNRDNSNDSRFWGSVPYNLVVGKPWLIYFSWDSQTKTVRWDRMGTFINDLQYEQPRY